MQTPHFTATRKGRGFPGGLLCRSACQGGWPLAAPRFAHPIPESRRRNRAGLNQRFLKPTGLEEKGVSIELRRLF